MNVGMHMGWIMQSTGHIYIVMHTARAVFAADETCFEVGGSQLVSASRKTVLWISAWSTGRRLGGTHPMPRFLLSWYPENCLS